MSDEREGLFVQLGALEAERLLRHAAASGRTKHQLVEDAVPAEDVLTTDDAAALLRWLGE